MRGVATQRARAGRAIAMKAVSFTSMELLLVRGVVYPTAMLHGDYTVHTFVYSAWFFRTARIRSLPQNPQEAWPRMRLMYGGLRRYRVSGVSRRHHPK